MNNSELEEQILEIVNSSESGVTTEEICNQLGKTPQELGDAFEGLLQEEKLHGFAGLWLSKTLLHEGTEKFMAALRELHQASPSSTSIAREKVVHKAALSWSGKHLDRILALLQQRGTLSVNGTTVRDPEFKIKLANRQRAFLDRVLAELVLEPVNTLGPHDMAKVLGAPPQALEEIFRLGVEAREIVQLAENVYYTPVQLEQLKERVRGLMKDKSFSTGDLRDALETTRKYVLPLLDYFDSIQFTTRIAENRVITGENGT